MRLLLAMGPTVLSAQENTGEVPEGPVYTLENYIVTGTAQPVRAFETPADVSALDGEEKLRRQTASLGEMLDHLPSVSTIATGSAVGKPVIRGLTDTRVRMLQDGIGVNYQQFGVRHPPNIDPFLTERIEVVRGVSSILYGSDAFGGAVNAISPRIQYASGDEWNHGGRGTYRYESGNDLHTGAVSLDLAQENWGLTGALVRRDAGNLTVPDTETFDGSGTQSPDVPKFDGELDFTDFEQTNAMLKGGYRLGNAEGTLRYERWEHENNYLLPNGKGIGVDLANNLPVWPGGFAGRNFPWRGLSGALALRPAGLDGHGLRHRFF
jgi:iron complex outermembrane receptor protein/hemoglobin/transferrin/lactoferrin receptor protein